MLSRGIEIADKDSPDYMNRKGPRGLTASYKILASIPDFSSTPDPCLQHPVLSSPEPFWSFQDELEWYLLLQTQEFSFLCSIK